MFTSRLPSITDVEEGRSVETTSSSSLSEASITSIFGAAPEGLGGIGKLLRVLTTDS